MATPYQGKWTPQESFKGSDTVLGADAGFMGRRDNADSFVSDSPLDKSSVFHKFVDHSALISPKGKGAKSKNRGKKGVEEPGASLRKLEELVANVDSGCSASVTYRKRFVVNQEACDEVFGAANGQLARAYVKGDLPAIAMNDQGGLVHVVFKNVRVVEEFTTHTLLSVTQMFEEQRIGSYFNDDL